MSLVRSHSERGVATVTLDSPGNRNALSTALIEELLAALVAADADDAVRVVVLTHTGPVFCSGADLKETAAAFAALQEGAVQEGAVQEGAVQEGTVQEGALQERRPPINRLGEVLTAIWESPKPVVARVTGPARAGGLGLIAAADLAVCSLDATFAFSEVRIGVIPAVISATVLPRLAPRAAAELYLTGSTFDGARAAQVGLVTEAVDPTLVDATVDAYVSALVRGAPGALAGTKQLLHRRKRDTFRDEVAELTELSVRYFGSAEGIAGILAFRDKRDPNWISNGPD